MTYRKHKVVTRCDSRIKVTIGYSNEYQEYRARLNIDGADQIGADYFTDDLRDAQLTAESMASSAEQQLTHQTRKLEWVD